MSVTLSTADTAKAEKRKFWSNHIKQWKASGQIQSDYCRQHQLKLHQFIYWKQVFSGKPNIKPPKTNGFVSVELIQPYVPPVQHLTLHLPNGIRIEGVDTNNLDLIHAIMRLPS